MLPYLEVPMTSPADDEHTAKQVHAKQQVQNLECTIETLANGRAKSLALTSLEECYMWIGKAIRDEQLAKQELSSTPKSPDLPPIE